jgi:hypothetical protein
LDLLLKISEENPELDDKVIGDEISLFIIAVKKIIKKIIIFFFLRSIFNSIINTKGFDSSSVAMNWFLYLIAKHPEHQVLYILQVHI